MARLAPPDRARILAIGAPAEFPPGAVLMHQGDPGTSLFILLSGLVKVTVTTSAGAETILALRGRGDVVGELAAIDENPRTATVCALGQVGALRVSGARYLALCRTSPVIAQRTMEILIGKIRNATDHRAAMRGQQARYRIAKLLCGLAERHGCEGGAGPVVLPVTQPDLAALAGVAGSTVERILKELREQRIVDTRYREIVIRQLDVLRVQAFGGEPPGDRTGPG